MQQLIQTLDGTSFKYTSGGTAKHTVIVLNDVQGEFVGGETITAFLIQEQEQFNLIH